MMVNHKSRVAVSPLQPAAGKGRVGEWTQQPLETLDFHPPHLPATRLLQGTVFLTKDK